MPFVSGLYTFQDLNLKHIYSINFKFDYDLSSVVYLLNYRVCNKPDVGSNVNAFRTRYYNHWNCFNRNGIGERGTAALIAIENLKKKIFTFIYAVFVAKEIWNKTDEMTF